MIDYLIRLSSITSARTAMANWLDKDEGGKDVFRLPTWCDLLPVDAYSALATFDAEGAQLTPPVLATGKWFIVSLDRDVELPTAAKAVIRAQGEREEGMKLPAGVVGLSTVWAGMTLTA